MGLETSTNENLQEIGKKANQESPNSFINTSIITLTNSTIVGECKNDAERDYKKLQILGEGSFATVYAAQNRITDIMRAMKIIKKDKYNSGNELEIINEINILKTMDHPNIVKLFEFYSNENNYSIIMEYCKGGILSNEI